MRKIGILEDDEKLASELKYFLETNGYEAVAWATTEYNKKTESELVDMLVLADLHMLLLDIGLPGFNGLHICKAYREKTDSPIIMITSQNTELTELMSITNGADDFVPKPFNPQILIARMEAVMKRVYKESSNSDSIKISTVGNQSFTIEILRGKIISESGEADLSKNELQIMKILADHHGEIVSRDDIINFLWDNQAFVDDNTLTVNMTRIKGKLESIGIKDAIVTKRGMGYELV